MSLSIRGGNCLWMALVRVFKENSLYTKSGKPAYNARLEINSWEITMALTEVEQLIRRVYLGRDYVRSVPQRDRDFLKPRGDASLYAGPLTYIQTCALSRRSHAKMPDKRSEHNGSTPRIASIPRLRSGWKSSTVPCFLNFFLKIITQWLHGRSR